MIDEVEEFVKTISLENCKIIMDEYTNCGGNLEDIRKGNTLLLREAYRFGQQSNSDKRLSTFVPEFVFKVACQVTLCQRWIIEEQEQKLDIWEEFMASNFPEQDPPKFPLDHWQRHKMEMEHAGLLPRT